MNLSIAMSHNIKIECLNVVKRYGEQTVLDRLSLTVDAGARLGLLGKSGAGKSTLLRIIAGLDELTSGTVMFQDATRLVSVPRPRIGMVFQNLALWPHLTAQQHVEAVLPGVSRRERRRRAESLFEELRIPQEAWSHSPGELSGGEAQRVSIARALAIEPDILLFDEPLAHVDDDLRRELVDLFDRIIRRQSVTTIYVTHRQAEAHRLADRLIAIKDGQITEIARS